MLFVLLHEPFFLPVLNFRLRRILRLGRLLSACQLYVLRVRLYLRSCLRLWRLLLRWPYSWLLRMLRVCLLWSLRYRLLRTLRLRISLYRCLCVYRLLGVWLLLLYRRFRLCLLFHQVEEASPVHFRVGCLYLLLDFLQLGGIRVCFRLCKL